jgi:hypothetical protein
MVKQTECPFDLQIHNNTIKQHCKQTCKKIEKKVDLRNQSDIMVLESEKTSNSNRKETTC